MIQKNKTVVFGISGKTETFHFTVLHDWVSPSEKKALRLKIATQLPSSMIPMHGVLISNGNKSILICGESKSGKSTLANELANQGYSIDANDFVAVWSEENDLYAGDINFVEISSKKEKRKLEHIFFLDSDHTLDIYRNNAKQLGFLYQKTLTPLFPKTIKKFINNSIFEKIKKIHICLGNRQSPERWVKSVNYVLNYKKPTKIGIIGAGTVGQDLANLLIDQRWIEKLSIYSPNQEKLGSIVYDLKSARPALNINQSNNAKSVFSNSDIVVFCFNQSNPTTTIATTNERLRKVIQHTQICEEIIKNIKSYPGIVLVVTNPVDLLSWYIYKHSDLMSNQVYGVGLGLDQKRLRVISNQNLDVIGEHGDQIRIIRKIDNTLYEDSDLDIRSKLTSYSNTIRQFAARTRFGPAHEVLGVIKSLRQKKSSIKVSTKYKQYFLGQSIDLYKSIPMIITGKLDSKLESLLDQTLSSYTQIIESVQLNIK